MLLMSNDFGRKLAFATSHRAWRLAVQNLNEKRQIRNRSNPSDTCEFAAIRSAPGFTLDQVAAALSWGTPI
jgi:hypothetical protein